MRPHTAASNIRFRLSVFRHAILSVFFVGVFSTFVVAPTAIVLGREPQAAGVEFFEKHIRPVLIEHCYECHTAKSETLMGGLYVDSRAGLLAGGDNGAAVVPGDPTAGALLSALRYEEFEMPPEGKLPDRTIALFEQWIRMGAPDPRDKAPAASGSTHDPASNPQLQDADSSSNELHWAFQPLKYFTPPAVEVEDWATSPIDRFVQARREAAGLQPVDSADRIALIRRATFDLWGLPPEPAAVERFLHDTSPQAFADLVDRLLDSPRFGERWGRHWLDVARYGESTGHERNFLYPHAWRYRDYVIQSFNQDKPYDRFLMEQLAGDLLPAATSEQRDEQLTATGFLAISPRNLLAGNEDFVFDTIDDQINVTSQAILGMTVACARCHDHKFDPIPTEDYYALAGIFRSTEVLYGTQPGTGGGNNRHPSPLIPLGEQAEIRQAAMLKHAAVVAETTKRLGQAENALKKLTSLPEAQLARKQDEVASARQAITDIKLELKQLENQAPLAPAYAMGVREAKEIGDTEVRISGNSKNLGSSVPRGVLTCCSSAVDQPQIPPTASGRLELAHWIVDVRNPLTARVMVNRVWHHLLGRGLVPSVDNFGRNGQLPSHPELLDWLAKRFQQDQWSVKQLIRRIMLSRTYQLSSTVDTDNYSLDPDNIWLWRCSPKRLEAEAIRDALLFASGQLTLQAPADGSVVARLGDGCLVRQIDAELLNQHGDCRSVYLPAARFFEPEELQVFDAASASLVVGDRAETNVPAQALFLLNNDFVIEQAKLTARRIARETATGDVSARIAYAYQLVLGRPPTPSEQQRSQAYLSQSQAVLLGANDDTEDSEIVWSGWIQALVAGAEFRYVY